MKSNNSNKSSSSSTTERRKQTTTRPKTNKSNRNYKKRKRKGNLNACLLQTRPQTPSQQITYYIANTHTHTHTHTRKYYHGQLLILYFTLHTGFSCLCLAGSWIECISDKAFLSNTFFISLFL